MDRSIRQNVALIGGLLRHEFDHMRRRGKRLRNIENLPAFMKTAKMTPFLEMSRAVFSWTMAFWVLRMAAFVDTTAGKVKEVIEDMRDTLPPDKVHLLSVFEWRDRPAWGASHIFMRSGILADWSDNQDPRSTVKGYLLHIQGKMEHFQTGVGMLKEKTIELMRRISRYRVQGDLIDWKGSLIRDCELIIRFCERGFSGVSIHDLENLFERCIFHREIEASYWKMLERNNELASIARQERLARKRERRVEQVWDFSIREGVTSGLQVLPVNVDMDEISIRLGKIGQRISNLFEIPFPEGVSDDAVSVARRLEEMRTIEDALDRIESGTNNPGILMSIGELRSRVVLMVNRITTSSSTTVQSVQWTLPGNVSLEIERAELSPESLAIIRRLEQVSASIKNVSSTRQNHGAPSFADGKMSNQVLRPLCNFAVSFIRENWSGNDPFSWSRILSNFPSTSECFQSRVIRALSGYSRDYPATNDPSIIIRQLTELLRTFISHWNFRWTGSPCSLLLSRMERLIGEES